MKNLKFRVKSPIHEKAMKAVIKAVWPERETYVTSTFDGFAYTCRPALMPSLDVMSDTFKEVDVSFLDAFIYDEILQRDIYELESAIRNAKQQIEELKNAKDLYELE